MKRSALVHSSIRLVVASTFFSIPLAAQEPEAFVARDTRLDLSIDYEKPKLSGSITYRLENWTTHPATRISFIIGRLMEASKVRDAAGASLPFSQDVVRFVDDSMRQVTQVRVQLPQPIPPGAVTTLTIDYSGYLVPYTEIGWLYVKDHIDTTFTIIREDALAFPSIGGISRAGNRKRPYPAFTYDASVRVPSKYVVATGGAVTRTSHNDGTTTWRYSSGKPADVLNVSIAPFDTLVNSGVRVFYFREDSVGARLLLSKTQTVLDTLKQWFGPLHSPLNLTITEIPNGWGSQASLVGGIIQSAAAFRDPTRLGEVYHELTHLWNVFDLENPSPRWNEGQATFLEMLLSERVDGWKRRREAEAQMIARVKRNIAADSSLRVYPFTDYGKHEITGNSYSVGAIMFSTLHDLVGEAEFNKILGGYYQRYAPGGTTPEFTNFAKQTASRDLKTFFDDWLYTTHWIGVLEKASSVQDLVEHYRTGT